MHTTVIIQVPWPNTTYVPRSSLVWIRCESTLANPWTILGKNDTTATPFDASIYPGIYIDVQDASQSLNNNQQTLFINNTIINNETRIKCVYQRSKAYGTTLFVYGTYVSNFHN